MPLALAWLAKIEVWACIALPARAHDWTITCITGDSWVGHVRILPVGNKLHTRGFVVLVLLHFVAVATPA